MRIVLPSEDRAARVQLGITVAQALELGSGKHEVDVADELFRTFGLDLEEMRRAVPPQVPNRAQVLQQAAGTALGDAVRTRGQIVDALVRVGGQFMAMLREVYAFLSRTGDTTSGTNDVVTLDRGDVDEEALTLSPGFLEQLSRIESLLVHLRIGRIQHEPIMRFLGMDGGELYGEWPVDGDTGQRIRLAERVLLLGWIGESWRERAREDPGWARAAEAGALALTQAQRLVVLAQTLVVQHAVHLEDLLDTAAKAGLSSQPAAHMAAEQAYVVAGAPGAAVDPGAVEEVARFSRGDGFLGGWLSRRLLEGMADTSPVAGAERDLVLGLRHGAPAWRSGPDLGGGLIGGLACWCAMFQLGIRPSRAAETLHAALRTSDEALAWAETTGSACAEALGWLGGLPVGPWRQVPAEATVEQVTELLHLPIWRQRSLIYEVWLLVVTLQACERAGWAVRLVGVERDARGWRLSMAPSPDPVAVLTRDGRLGGGVERLEVWREPVRDATDGGKLTPDVTVSTTGRLARDLVVVEGKDRIRMGLGGGRDGAEVPSPKSALGVATRYAVGLRAPLTWVCNHVSFAAPAPADVNHGDPWTAIHVAADFRPGAVPDEFARTVATALRSAYPDGRLAAATDLRDG